MVDSLVRTGGNLIHPSRYGKAIRNGRIVDTVLEDAGNIARGRRSASCSVWRNGRSGGWQRRAGRDTRQMGERRRTGRQGGWWHR